ncbi:MAG: hypothetical protein HYX97_02925 [Chloroflexi bacterium]|nr:hypothetical protein [Chloroflexota bacterium]
MEAEAATNGVEARVLHFVHYAPEANVMYIDLGMGDVLRLDGQSITTIDNGSEGVLFKMGRYGKPWTYHPEPPYGLLENTLIRSVNFMSGEEVPLTPEEQGHLMLL